MLFLHWCFSLLLTVVMANTIECFQFVQKLYRREGIYPVSKVRVSFVMLSITILFISSTSFLFLEANSLQEYGDCFYTSVTLFMFIICGPSIISNGANIYAIVVKLDEVVQKSMSKFEHISFLSTFLLWLWDSIHRKWSDFNSKISGNERKNRTDDKNCGYFCGKIKYSWIYWCCYSSNSCQLLHLWLGLWFILFGNTSNVSNTIQTRSNIFFLKKSVLVF